eukprot:267133_1
MLEYDAFSCHFNDSLCGCTHLINNINSNYIDNDEIIESQFDVNCCDYSSAAKKCRTTTTESPINTIGTTNSKVTDSLFNFESTESSNEDASKSDDGLTDHGVAGIISGILALIIVLLIVFCVYKNKNNNNKRRGIHVPKQKKG